MAWVLNSRKREAGREATNANVFLCPNQNGQMLIVAALCMMVVMGLAAMAIDAGLFLHERRSMQNAADAAALAGAQDLPSDPGQAKADAQQWITNNGFSAQDIQSINVTSTHGTNDTVTVQLKSNFDWIFGRALGLIHSDVSAQGSAIIGSPAVAAGLKPWGVLQNAINWNGQPTVLKYDSTNPTTGNFGALAIDGSGASIYQATIKYGSKNTLCGLSQPGCANPTATTETGNMLGPTSTGVNWLIDNTSATCSIFSNVFTQRPDGTYDINTGCNPWLGATDSNRIILIPVIQSLCNGKCDVTILSFAVFFLNNLGTCTGHSCQITGQFVKLVADPTSVFELGALNANNAVRVIRLVQ